MVLEGLLEHAVHVLEVLGHRQPVVVLLDGAHRDARAAAPAGRSPPRATTGRVICSQVRVVREAGRRRASACWRASSA